MALAVVPETTATLSKNKLNGDKKNEK